MVVEGGGTRRATSHPPPTYGKSPQAVSADGLSHWGGALLDLLSSRADGHWFAKPVDEDDTPDYALVVSDPLDMEKIRGRLRGGEYGADASAFAADVREA